MTVDLDTGSQGLVDSANDSGYRSIQNSDTAIPARLDKSACSLLVDDDPAASSWLPNDKRSAAPKATSGPDSAGKDVTGEDESPKLTVVLPLPLDGGYGWVIVAVSFVINAMIDGLLASFGVIMPHLVTYFASTQGNTALIGSVMTGVFLAVGPLAAAGVNLLGCRVITVAGALLTTASLVVSVTSPSVEVMIFIFGVVGGTGLGLMSLPAMVMVGYYFEKRRALATGIACSGSGVGVLVMAPVSALVIQEYDWKNCLVILSTFTLHCVICGALMRPLEDNYPKAKLQMGDDDVMPDAASGVRAITASHVDGDLTNQDKVYISTGSIKARTGVPNGVCLTSSNGCLHPMERTEQGFTGDNSKRVTSLYLVDDGSRWGATGGQRTGSFREIQHHAPFLPKYLIRGAQPSVSCHALYNTPGLATSPGATPTTTPTERRRALTLSPMLRKDIFYSGSLNHLSSNHEDRGDSVTTSSRRLRYSPHAAKFSSQEGALVVGAEDDAEEPSGKSTSCTSPSPGCSPDMSVLREMIDLTILKNSHFLVICLAQGIIQLGYFIPIVFLPTYAVSLGITEAKAALLVSIFGVSNTLGRGICGAVSISPRMNKLHFNNISLITSGILCFLVVLLARDFSTLAVFTAVYGFTIAIFVPLITVFLVEFVGIQKLTNAFGILCMSKGLISPAGPPIAGAILDATGSYQSVFFFAGTLFIVAGLIQYILPCLRYVRSRNKQKDVTTDKPKPQWGKTMEIYIDATDPTSELQTK